MSFDSKNVFGHETLTVCADDHKTVVKTGISRDDQRTYTYRETRNAIAMSQSDVTRDECNTGKFPIHGSVT